MCMEVSEWACVLQEGTELVLEKPSEKRSAVVTVSWMCLENKGA